MDFILTHFFNRFKSYFSVEISILLPSISLTPNHLLGSNHRLTNGLEILAQYSLLMIRRIPK